MFAEHTQSKILNLKSAINNKNATKTPIFTNVKPLKLNVPEFCGLLANLPLRRLREMHSKPTPELVIPNQKS